MFDFVKEQSLKNPVTEEYVSEVEQTYGIQFPSAFKRYILEHNGRQIEPVWFEIGGEYYEVRKISQLKDPGLSLEDLLASQRTQGFPVFQMIPIADDRANGIYYYHMGNETIYYSQLEGEDDFIKVCHGMDAFFELLDKAYCHGGKENHDIGLFLKETETADKRNFLPIGSVVQLQRGAHKIMIVARGVTEDRDGDTWFIDYNGVSYPEGYNYDHIMCFAEKDIEKVCFRGYAGIEDDAVQAGLNDYLETHPNICFGCPE